MVDGFDGGCQVASLCTQDFYNHARAALRKNGVLVVNLLSRQGIQELHKRIENSFSGNVATLMAEPIGNVIAFAFRQNPGKRVWNHLPRRAKNLNRVRPSLYRLCQKTKPALYQRHPCRPGGPVNKKRRCQVTG